LKQARALEPEAVAERGAVDHPREVRDLGPALGHRAGDAQAGMRRPRLGMAPEEIGHQVAETGVRRAGQGRLGQRRMHSLSLGHESQSGLGCPDIPGQQDHLFILSPATPQ